MWSVELCVVFVVGVGVSSVVSRIVCGFFCCCCCRG